MRTDESAKIEKVRSTIPGLNPMQLMKEKWYTARSGEGDEVGKVNETSPETCRKTSMRVKFAPCFHSSHGQLCIVKLKQR